MLHPIFGNPKLSLTDEQKTEAREAIKFLRTKGVTHLQVAAKIGINPSSVRNWFENGSFPSKQVFPALIQIYKENKGD